LLALLAGCGGGGGGSTILPPTTLKSSGDNSISLVGAASALPAGVTVADLVLTPKAAADVPGAPAGAAFVAAVECGPAGTVFSSPVNLVFTLNPARAPGEKLPVFLLSGGLWTAASTATVAADGLTATAPITHFSTYGLFVTEQTALAGDKIFRFDLGVIEDGLPAEIMYNDTHQELVLPHAAAFAVQQAYDDITQAPFVAYDDSNGANPPTFPATAGKVYVFRSYDFGTATTRYYKLQVLSATAHDNQTYGVVTFKYEQILPLSIVAASGEWDFDNGAHLSVMMGGVVLDYTAGADAPVIAIEGYYTDANTLVGTWANTATQAGGDVTVTLTLSDGQLDATLVGTNGLDSVTLTNGTKQQ
ncbi:MAG TPA: hypothetical protein PLZ36_11010, partial [Armatimonadota bacterium]|nr:hypothetical protein [Armatimonadota bacterium]